MKIETIKHHASGQWLNIIRSLAPELSEACDRPGQHVKCHCHGERDGFRLFDDVAQTGGGVCTQTGSYADGFALLQWANSWDFKQTLNAVADHLGLNGSNGHTGAKLKTIKADRLKAIWEKSFPGSSRVCTYIEGRGLLVEPPETLRGVDSLDYYATDNNGYPKKTGSFPAMIAPFQKGGKIIGYHHTYLSREGDGKAEVDTVRKCQKLKKTLSGASIQLYGVEPDKPLIICEGVETGLALRQSTGWPVWATSGKSLLESVEVPADVEKIYIGTDLDQDGGGERSARKLAARLKRQGHTVFMLVPPGPIPTETKSIDWLDVLNDKGMEEVWNEFVSADPLSELTAENNDEGDGAKAGGYELTPDGIIWYKPTKEGTAPKKLTNFQAVITAEVHKDDGAEVKIFFEVSAKLSGRKFSFTVSAADFSGMAWVIREMGANALLSPGTMVKDHTRYAIQLLSTDIDRKVIYGHYGWRLIGKEWLYLHSGGAIGPKGSVPDINIETQVHKLADYNLPDPPTGENLRLAVRATLNLLELAPPRIIFPLLASIFRAPLGEMAPIDFSPFLVGPTGCQKTELSALVQAHFGAGFHGKNLPGNWNTTANSLERQAFLVKDMVFVIDDFAPSGSQYDVSRSHKDADKIFRGAGNRSGRGRMRADGSLKSENFPRGMVVSSGEDIPKGQSCRARMIVLEIARGEVDLGQLSQAQRDAADGLFAKTMAAYVKWLASQMNDLKESLPRRRLALRDKARETHFDHDRTPDNFVSLILGFEMFSRFACESGVITGAERERLDEQCWAAIKKTVESQSGHQASEDPAIKFLELLSTVISSGQGHIADPRKGEEPPDAWMMGWREVTVGAGMNARPEWRPQGNKIGWIEDDNIFLDPNSAYAATQKLAGDQGDSLAITQQTLWKRLFESGYLAAREESRVRIRKILEGIRRRVIHIKLAALSMQKTGPTGPTEPQVLNERDLWTKNMDRFSEGGRETGHKTGPQPQRNQDEGPDGPVGPIFEIQEAQLFEDSGSWENI